MQIRILGDIRPLVEWAKAHETDRLWCVDTVGSSILPVLRPVYYHQLDAAIKAAAELTGKDKVWFREELRNNYDEPMLGCWCYSDAGAPMLICLITPQQMGAMLPAGWTLIDTSVED